MKNQTIVLSLLAACLLLTGCGTHPLVAWNDEHSEQLEQVTVLLNSIQTPEDADAKLEEVRDRYARLVALKREAPALFRKHAKDKVRKSTTTAMRQRLQAAEQNAMKAATKIQNRKDLSEPFCSMLRVKSMELMLAAAEVVEEMNQMEGVPRQPQVANVQTARQCLELFEEHGPARVVEVRIVGGDEDDAQLIVDAGDGEAAGLILANNAAVVVGPVNDFDSFCASLEGKGELSNIDKSRRSFNFQPKREAFSPSARERLGSDHASRLGSASFSGEMPSSVRERFEAAAREHGFDLPKRFGGDQEGAREPSAGAEPGSLPALAEELTSGDLFEKKRAAKRLLDVNPADIKDKAVRAKIARGYRALISDSHFMAFDGETAIQGLVRYAGKHSAPIIAKHLAETRMTAPDAAFDALVKHPTAEGIQAVVGQLKNPPSRHAASAAIRKIGAASEEPLLALAEEEDPFATVPAIELLGEVGTRKSYRLLRAAGKSRMPDVRRAATLALRSVQKREKARRSAEG